VQGWLTTRTSSSNLAFRGGEAVDLDVRSDAERCTRKMLVLRGSVVGSQQTVGKKA